MMGAPSTTQLTVPETSGCLTQVTTQFPSLLSLFDDSAIQDTSWPVVDFFPLSSPTNSEESTDPCLTPIHYEEA